MTNEKECIICLIDASNNDYLQLDCCKQTVHIECLNKNRVLTFLLSQASASLALFERGGDTFNSLLTRLTLRILLTVFVAIARMSLSETLPVIRTTPLKLLTVTCAGLNRSSLLFKFTLALVSINWSSTKAPVVLLP